MPTRDEIVQQQVLRTQFLGKLYDLSKVTRRADGRVDTVEVVHSITPHGLPDTDVRRLVKELSDDGLVAVAPGYRQPRDPYEPLIELTPYGRKSVEEWVAKDSEPTTEMPVPHSVVNNVNIGSAPGGTIVIGSSHTTLTSANTLGSSLEQIAQLVREILKQSPLDDQELQEELEDDVATLEEQSRLSDPNPSRVKAALRRLARFLVGAAGAAETGVRAGLTEQAQELITHSLGQLTN